MKPKLMERAPGFIGTAGVPLVRQANISLLAEFILDIEDVKDKDCGLIEGG